MQDTEAMLGSAAMPLCGPRGRRLQINSPRALLDACGELCRITPDGAQALLGGLKRSSSNPYLVLFVEHVPHMQATSWEQQGRPNAP